VPFELDGPGAPTNSIRAGLGLRIERPRLARLIARDIDQRRLGEPTAIGRRRSTPRHTRRVKQLSGARQQVQRPVPFPVKCLRAQERGWGLTDEASDSGALQPASTRCGFKGKQTVARHPHEEGYQSNRRHRLHSGVEAAGNADGPDPQKPDLVDPSPSIRCATGLLAHSARRRRNRRSARSRPRLGRE